MMGPYSTQGETSLPTLQHPFLAVAHGGKCHALYFDK